MVNNKGYIRNQYHPFIVHHPSFIINRLSRLSPSHTASVLPLFQSSPCLLPDGKLEKHVPHYAAYTYGWQALPHCEHDNSHDCTAQIARSSNSPAGRWAISPFFISNRAMVR